MQAPVLDSNFGFRMANECFQGLAFSRFSPRFCPTCVPCRAQLQGWDPGAAKPGGAAWLLPGAFICGAVVA